MPIEIDSPEVLERARLELAKQVSIMKRYRPDSVQQEAASAEAKGYLRALLENGLISPEARKLLDDDMKAQLYVPPLSNEKYTAMLENSPVMKILKDAMEASR